MDAQLAELRSYVELDDADLVRLLELWPHVEPHAARVIDHFYAKVLSFEATRQVLENESQVGRLKQTLRVWLEELLVAPRDARYVERRRAIGRRHVSVGLDARYMSAAGQVVADDLAAIARASLPPEDALAAMGSLHRALTVDLAIVNSTYVEGRERVSAIDLQELLIQHLRVTALLADADGRVTAATPSTRALFGSNEPCVGRPWDDVIPADLREAAHLDRVVARALESGQDIALPRVVCRDRTWAIHVVPLRHSLARVLLQIEDLSEAVALEARLRRTESLAQLGALSAAVAHELRNPLAGISGAIQVIGRSIPDSAPYASVMLKVEAEIRRLDTLVSDLLAFSRPRAPEVQPVDLGAAARRAIELVRADHPEARFTVRGSGSGLGDADLVHQILLNLLQNSVQAIAKGGRVELDVVDGAVRVSDDGPGVAEDVAQHVFEPFFTTKTRGTGLGLAICQRAATSMGGNISLVPHGPLGGATFELALPT